MSVSPSSCPSTLGMGRASDSLCCFFLIPHGLGQALLPGNQLSQSLASLSLHLLSHLPVAPSQGSPSSPLRQSACSRVTAASGWQRWLEKPRAGCCFCLQWCSPIPLSSCHPLLLLPHLAKVYASVKTCIHPTNTDECLGSNPGSAVHFEQAPDL